MNPYAAYENIEEIASTIRVDSSKLSGEPQVIRTPHLLYLQCPTTGYHESFRINLDEHDLKRGRGASLEDQVVRGFFGRREYALRKNEAERRAMLGGYQAWLTKPEWIL